jgi:hypothetical protein
VAFLVQMWDPLFQVSPLHDAFAHDFLRAQQVWMGETRVWLDPRTREVQSWIYPTDAGGFPECCVPAETFNCLIIFYVDEQRQTWPPVLLPTGNTLPEGLYRQWLNTTPRLVEGCETVWMPVPSVTNGGVGYYETEIRLSPGPSMAVEHGRLIWPSRIPSLPPVSPEAEAARGEAPVHVWLQWPAPFDVLFHDTGGGMDMFFHHQEALRRCIEALDTGKRRHRDVLREAETWVARLTGEVEVPLVQAWLMPKILANPKAALFEVKARYDLEADTVEELLASEAFAALRRERVSVRRIQGWLGYFWWEFYQDLVAHIPIGTCKACGNLIHGGRKDRRYCTRSENTDCWRKRTSARQRKSRTGES